MHFILFIILLIVFVWTASRLLKTSTGKTKAFLLLAALCFIVLCTLMLFSFHHVRLDWVAVILLLITTAALVLFLTIRKVK